MKGVITEYRKAVCVLVIIARNPMHGIRRPTFSLRTRTLELLKHLANPTTFALLTLARIRNPTRSRAFSMPFANIAPSKALAYAETSTVFTPLQKHPASFQVFSNTLHDVDVGLAHALTSGIVTHVDTLGPLLLFLRRAHKRAPQKVTTKKMETTFLTKASSSRKTIEE